MGDTTTHREIAEQIIAILEAARPDEEMYYFELGNWLTDISQMRDPTAMVGGKSSIWDQKTNIFTAGLAELAYKLEEYLDDLMGLPGPQGGLLAAWLRDLCSVVGLEKFRKHGIQPDRFQAIYDLRFTQYYPHEHVDFPPWPRHDIIGERNPSQWAVHQCSQPPTAGSGRNIYQYQEEQLVYISDLLTVVDQKWARQQVTPDLVESRQEVLTRFGHVSHAVEDFFFHSNFVERAWFSTGQSLPDHPDDSPDDGDDHDHEEPGPRNPTREERRYYRRMRAPVGSGDNLSTTTSNPMDQVYTGFFGAKDVFHTLIDGLKGIIHNELPSPADQMVTNILGTHQEDETPDQRDQRRKNELAQHKKLLFDGTYETAAKAAGALGRLHPKSVEAIQRVCQMDRNLWQKYPKVDLGISGFVKTLVEMAEDEAARSKTVWTQLDSTGVTDDDRTDNGASNENVGSHSLMSKDSVRKHPLRQQAFNVASGVALYVAKRMVQPARDRLPVARSVNQAQADSDGGSSNTAAVQFIDWLHLVQHFVCHPSEAETLDSNQQPWWKPQMVQPDPDDTGHALRFIDEATVNQRLQEKKKKELEQKYDQLAVDAEKEWQKARGRATGSLVGMAIGAIAGAVAGAIVGAAVGGVAGAIVGGILGAIGGAVIGGLLGSLIGGWLS